MSATDPYIIEQAYAFFHQKERVYVHSTSEREKDHIEDAIASYVNAMSPALYAVLSEGNDAYLKEHEGFGGQLRDALEKMERMLSGDSAEVQ
ncbi:MAG: hypothetical protein IJV32_06820 [Bacteroidales bacterium]|nr:hypothetical protein [Bacteroidales bacterium]